MREEERADDPGVVLLTDPAREGVVRGVEEEDLRGVEVEASVQSPKTSFVSSVSGLTSGGPWLRRSSSSSEEPGAARRALGLSGEGTFGAKVCPGGPIDPVRFFGGVDDGEGSGRCAVLCARFRAGGDEACGRNSSTTSDASSLSSSLPASSDSGSGVGRARRRFDGRLSGLAEFPARFLVGVALAAAAAAAALGVALRTRFDGDAVTMSSARAAARARGFFGIGGAPSSGLKCEASPELRVERPEGEVRDPGDLGCMRATTVDMVPVDCGWCLVRA